jgi:hypothetical protein
VNKKVEEQRHGPVIGRGESVCEREKTMARLRSGNEERENRNETDREQRRLEGDARTVRRSNTCRADATK